MKKNPYTPPLSRCSRIVLEDPLCAASNEPANTEVNRGATVTDYSTVDNSSFDPGGDFSDKGGITFD